MNKYSLPLMSSVLAFFFLLAFSVFFLVLSSQESSLLRFELISLGLAQAYFVIVLDSLSVSFVALVCMIAAATSVFSQDYMKQERDQSRFSVLLSMFVLAMALFVLTPNLVTLLLGWDGLGVISFVLVLYYNNYSSMGAALITALTNRVGDCLILVSVGMMAKEGDWDIMSCVFEGPGDKLWVLLVLASCTKSAQFPFCAWLPQAMAAPTPVSALVHSSTLVTAGVFLLIRLTGSMGSVSPSTLEALSLVSALTSALAGLGALVETDLKKVVALSTLSQLGVMMLSISLSAPLLAYFHLVTHAVTKSLLFISVGWVISYNGGGQDLRSVKGGVWAHTPFAFMGVWVASASLCGFPFTSGFFSKDLILETVWESGASFLVVGLMVVSTACTVAYSMKLLGFFVEEGANESGPWRGSAESECFFLKGPVMVLGSFSVMFGYVLSKSVVCFYSGHLLGPQVKLLTMVVMLSGYLLWEICDLLNEWAHFLLHSFLFLEFLTGQGLLWAVGEPVESVYKSLDSGWIEALTVGFVERAILVAMGVVLKVSKTPGLTMVARSVVIGFLVFLVFVW
uniref:NADH dehydrogenase subunit 5 n=1 Tax=Patelloida saccharinoides TaxID=225156 RepID=UPI0023D7D934|nr:NADH dehydrogenase subunit 5 [Patelloida saccharinoides]WCR50872.1 NADH dehydrogenase subunit 5 [Patelloida saccharinoides]